MVILELLCLTVQIVRIHLNLNKVELVKTWLKLHSVTNIRRRFLDIFQFVGKGVQNIDTSATPLTDMTKEGAVCTNGIVSVRYLFKSGRPVSHPLLYLRH